MSQRTLPFGPENRREEMRQQTIAFHRTHPEVWREFCRLALAQAAKGFTQYSARTLWEVLRWHFDTPGEDAFKLNDHYPPFYARAFMRLHPEHVGFFSLRKQRSAEWRPKKRPDMKPPSVSPDDELDERDEWPLAP